MTLTPNKNIETAIRNAEREYDLYRVENTGRGQWNVTRWNDASRDYTVKADSETYEWICDCPSYERTQTVCKHCIICRMFEEEMTELERREAEFEVSEGDRFFMAECQREQFAEIAGAWN